LFKLDLDESIKYDIKRQYVFMYLDLERILRDICIENRAKFDDHISIQQILEFLKKKGIDENSNLEFNLERVIELHNTLIPQTIDIQEDQDIDEGLTLLSEIIESLNNNSLKQQKV
jgi:hypothetical protein